MTKTLRIILQYYFTLILEKYYSSFHTIYLNYNTHTY